MDRRLIDKRELCRRLDVSPRTVDRLIAERRCPDPVRIGRLLRWPEDQITTWIAAGCPAPGQDGGQR